MATIITKQSKGTFLTHAEVDSNFTNLNDDLLTKAGLTLNNTLTGNNKFTGRIQVGDTPGTDVGVALGRLGVHNTIGSSVFASTVSGGVAIMSSSATDVSYGSIGNYEVVMKVNGQEVGRFTPTMTKVLGNLAVGAITTPQSKLHVLTTSPITSRFQNVQTMIDFGQLSKGVAFVQSKLLNGTSSSLIINPEGGQVYVGADTQRVKIDNRVEYAPNPISWTQNYLLVDTSNGLMGWGFNSNGQLADWTGVAHGTPYPMKFGTATTKPNSNSRVVDIVMGGACAFVVYDNGWVYSVGANTVGQLGHGDTFQRPALKRIDYFVDNGIGIAKLLVSTHSIQNTTGQTTSTVMALGTNNVVYVWGSVYLGNGTGLQNISTPTPVLTSTDARGIWLGADGTGHSFFVNDAGILKAWGSNHNGCLGVNSSASPISTITNCVNIVGNVSNVIPNNGYNTAFSVYYGFTIAMTDDGNVWSSGYNANGQLGLSNTTSRNTFAQLNDITSDVVSIYSQRLGPYSCSYALDSLGRVWSWGFGANGGRGDGLVADKPTPSLTGATGVNALYTLSSSSVYSGGLVFLKTTSNVLYGWGQVNSGDCAMLAETASSTIIPSAKIIDLPSLYQGEFISGVTGRDQLGNSSIMLVTNFGRMFSTGYNVNGELGTHQPNAPVRTYGWKSIDFN